MFDTLANLTPHQRLWGNVMIQTLLDAVEGPMDPSLNRPGGADPDEYESRLISIYQVTELDQSFCFACEAVGFNPVTVRDSFIAGNMTRESLYYAMGKLSSR